MAIQEKFPSIRPSLNLDFANTKTLDPRVTFSRASTATYYDGKTFAKAEENLLLNSATLSTQTRSVTAVEHTLSFTGTGTITLSGASIAGPLVGTGENNRVVLTFTPSAGNLTLTVTGTVTKAQLEARSSATAWIETTTQPITNYVPVLRTAAAGVARFDHNPVTGESLGLLIEEQRTNLFNWSEAFNNAAWSKFNVSVDANVAVSPSGEVTAEKLVPDNGLDPAAASGVGIQRFFSLADVHVFSFFVKRAEHSGCRLRNNSTGALTDIDLNTGVVTGETSVVSAHPVGNGWFRVVIKYVGGQNINRYSIRTNTAGDGYSGIYIWGAQVEAGAFPTSYIKTEASQVTRAADNTVMTGTNFSSWYRADEGTLYAESNRLATLSANTPLVILNGPNTNLIRIRADGLGYIFEGFYNNSNQFSAILGTTNRFSAVAYQLNNSVGASAGVLGSVDTSCLVPLGVSDMQIGFQPYTSSRYSGHIRKIAYYPQRLTNTQLQALTS